MTRILTIAFTVWRDILRRKDVYVLLILLGAILSMLTSLDVFGLGSTVAYVMDLGLVATWLFGWILSIHVSSRELPQEESRGTVFSLLAKPITRIELILGKWLGAWSVVCAAVFIFYALVMTVVAARGGSFDAVAVLQGVILHCGVIAVMTAIGLAFSTRMNHDAAASISYVTTATALLVVPAIPHLMTQAKGINAGLLLLVYNVFPHFEVMDMRLRIVHGYGAAPLGAVAAALLYGILWAAIPIVIAWLGYRRKRFTRSKLN